MGLDDKAGLDGEDEDKMGLKDRSELDKLDKLDKLGK